jgi:hypothetical protein
MADGNGGYELNGSLLEACAIQADYNSPTPAEEPTT